jgi:hypothetical protein
VDLALDGTHLRGVEALAAAAPVLREALQLAVRDQEDRRQRAAVEVAGRVVRRLPRAFVIGLEEGLAILLASG